MVDAGPGRTNGVAVAAVAPDTNSLKVKCDHDKSKGHFA